MTFGEALIVLFWLFALFILPRLPEPWRSYFAGR